MTAHDARAESGQALSEYLMIAGLLTALIISVTAIISPAFTFVIVGLVEHMAVYMTTP